MYEILFVFAKKAEKKVWVRKKRGGKRAMLFPPLLSDSYRWSG
jgi:hypothetical protein